MAVDSRDKRSSAIVPGMPWRGLLPVPDSGVNAGDRQHVSYLYRGIAADSPVTTTAAPGAEFTVPRSTAEFTLRPSRAEFTVPRLRAEYTVRGDNQ